MAITSTQIATNVSSALSSQSNTSMSADLQSGTFVLRNHDVAEDGMDYATAFIKLLEGEDNEKYARILEKRSQELMRSSLNAKEQSILTTALQGIKSCATALRDTLSRILSWKTPRASNTQTGNDKLIETMMDEVTQEAPQDASASDLSSHFAGRFDLEDTQDAVSSCIQSQLQADGSTAPDSDNTRCIHNVHTQAERVWDAWLSSLGPLKHAQSDYASCLNHAFHLQKEPVQQHKVTCTLERGFLKDKAKHALHAFDAYSRKLAQGYEECIIKYISRTKKSSRQR